MNTNILRSLKYVFKVYDEAYDKIAKKHNITGFELKILFFLKHNHEFNTARDIVEKLYINKSKVSEAVDNLTKNGYLAGKQDENDRRYVHLLVQDKAKNIIKDVVDFHANFMKEITYDIPDNEVNIFEKTVEKIMNNVVDISKKDSERSFI